jgi:hypothetical protein
MTSGGNPRYSNRRNDRGTGEDTEEEYHRGGSYSNSGKYQGNARSSGRGNFSQKPGGKGNDLLRRRGGSVAKEDQQLRDGSSVDRGKISINLLKEMYFIQTFFLILESQSSNENTNRRRRRNNNNKNPTHSSKHTYLL